VFGIINVALTGLGPFILLPKYRPEWLQKITIEVKE